jgi:hypothetical protein
MTRAHRSPVVSLAFEAAEIFVYAGWAPRAPHGPFEHGAGFGDYCLNNRRIVRFLGIAPLKQIAARALEFESGFRRRRCDSKLKKPVVAIYVFSSLGIDLGSGLLKVSARSDCRARLTTTHDIFQMPDFMERTTVLPL